MHLAVYSKQSRALRVLRDVLTADATFDTVLWQLHALQPSPLRDVTSRALSELPPHPDLLDDRILLATCLLTPTFASGPHLMSLRLFCRLTFNAISSQARITGLSTLTALLNRLAKRKLPTSTRPLSTAATVLLLHPRLDEARSVAIEQALTTVARLFMAIQNTAEHLSPEHPVIRVRAGTDSTARDCRMLSRRCEWRKHYVWLYINARNAINAI